MKPLKLFILILALAFAVNNCGYNKIQELDEDANATFAEILNQYKRRADLVPNLVKVVEAYAKHEKDVFTEVTKARSSAGTIQVTPEVLKDPEAFSKFQKAQGELGSALQKLLAVSENYPELKANENFLSLQAQLEGTENRIAVARGRHIKAVRDYNVYIRQFPQNVVANIFNYKTKISFTTENESDVQKLSPEITKPPEVKM